jgi:hypothetical protein
MFSRNAEKLKAKPTRVTRAALEALILDGVKSGDPQCKGLLAVFVERVVPSTYGGANWVVKGVKYGSASRAHCGPAIKNWVKDKQQELELSD